MKASGTNIIVSLVFAAGVRSAVAWDIDPRCPPPPSPMKRALEQDEDAWLNTLPTSVDVDATKALRGNTPSRDLQATGVFSLKMYWEEGYCWQEEYSRHRKWCWECQGGCKQGGILWWQKCVDSKDQKFTYLPDPEGGRFKTAYHDLCLQRVSTTQYNLQKCSTDKAQVIVGLRADGPPFELTPLGDSGNCINQDHHPKAGEIVENTTCKIARKWSTNLMELFDVASDIDPDIDNQARIRVEECSKSNPCDRCQGDCDEDAECRGTDLMCFQRGGSTKDAPVPGCKGVAVTDGDYCISRNLAPAPSTAPVPVPMSPSARAISPSARPISPSIQPISPSAQPISPSAQPISPSAQPFSPSAQPISSSVQPTSSVQGTPLNTKIRKCSPTKPCNQCEGDCDVDMDCKAGLKCFQKTGGVDVPGCVGRDMSSNDFCYLP